MDKFWSVQTGNGGANLYLLNEIARRESWFSDRDTPKKFHNELRACEGDLNVWIDSPGGDTFAGAAIYGMLREYSASGRGRVIANIVGIAASAAGLIAMAADEVRISVVGTFMLHDPLCDLMGNSEELRRSADVLDEIREGQIGAYMRKSGKTHDEVLALIKGAGTYMNAKTAIENGFADSLLHDDGGDWAQSLLSTRVNSLADRSAEQLRDVIASASGSGAYDDLRKMAARMYSAAPDDDTPEPEEQPHDDGGSDPQEPVPTDDGAQDDLAPDDPAPDEREEQVRALLRACIV